MQTKTFKTIKEYNKAYNVNNEVNQNIKGEFVRQHVYTCFSYEMEEILKAGLVNYEEIENIYIDASLYEEYGYNSEEEFEKSGENYHEIYEWWIVSGFLYGKLRDKGYPVLNWGSNYYWGRTTTGQAILFDEVISEICFEMEILQEQKHSWEKSRKA